MVTNTMFVFLEVISGSDDGRVFRFSDLPLSLGRHSSDDLFIPNDLKISRHHALISQESQSFFLEDIGKDGVGSTNGTFLNDSRIDSKTILHPGDVINIGDLRLKFSISV